MSTNRPLQWCALVACVAGFASWRLATVAGQQTPGTHAVRTVPTGQRSVGEPGKKGSTYYALESQSRRTTTRFADGNTAVAERAIDGEITATLADVSGNEVNHVRWHPNTSSLDYTPASSQPIRAIVDAAVRPTLDWANDQSHHLHRDHVAASTRLEWKDGLMRAPKSTLASEADVLAIETVWANGLTARTVRRTGTADGVVLVTRITNALGAEVGQANYLVRDRIYTWNLPGVSEGTITAAHLKAQYGGWLFTPDLVWMNLQVLGAYQWGTLLKERGTVARRERPRNGIVEFFAPSLAANEPGCDYLHYLDGTNFRPCCDVHDSCYEAQSPPCTERSWWQWGNWQCDVCNFVVAVCFYVAGDSHIRHPFGL